MYMWEALGSIFHRSGPTCRTAGTAQLEEKLRMINLSVFLCEEWELLHIGNYRASNGSMLAVFLYLTLRIN